MATKPSIFVSRTVLDSSRLSMKLCLTRARRSARLSSSRSGRARPNRYPFSVNPELQTMRSGPPPSI